MKSIDFLEDYHRRGKTKKNIINLVLFSFSFFFVFYSLGIIFIPNSTLACHGSIFGCKYSDVNNNGVIDIGEEKLSGWEIILDGDAQSSATTGQDGCYSFNNLFPGDYTVSEGENLSKQPFVLTYPSINEHQINFVYQSGDPEIYNIDFANYLPFCGNNILDDGEQCDGDQGVGDYQSCSEICTLTDLTYCGDGIKQTPNDDEINEECDGTDGVGDHQLCSEVCDLTDLTYCGDGVKQTPNDDEINEECDGTDGVGDYQSCSEICTLTDLTYCGDGVKQTPNDDKINEECDGTDGVGDHQECSEVCDLTDLIYCGDGVKNGGEECDDGNDIDGDGCSNNCHIPAPPTCVNCGPVIISYSPRLLLDKSVDKISASQGDMLNYTIKISNINNQNGTDLLLIDDLPTGFKYTDYEDQLREWNLGAINIGETKTVDYKVRINDDTPAGFYINTATATVSNGFSPHNKATDDAKVEVTIMPGRPILTINKDSELPFANPGGKILYNIIVKNIGEKEASNVIVIDSLPDGFTEINSEQTEMLWDLGDLDSGASTTINYTVFVDTSVENGEYDNIATAEADNHSIVSDTHTIEVKKGEVLGIEILPDTSGEILSGKRIIYLFAIAIIFMLILLNNNKKYKNEVSIDFLKSN
ncbi:SdrD B-like domain-containing protein [Patescibacteria group bacterium]